MIDKNDELEIVKRLSGASDESRISINEIGWTSRVYVIDGENRVGIIDFGDAGLYDRSQDFRGMDDEILRESMLNTYGNDKIISTEAAETTSKMEDLA